MDLAGEPSALKRRGARSADSMIVIGAFAVLGLVMAAVALGIPYTHDEELYVTVAHMSQDYRLYRDFVYGMAPYYPIMLAPVLDAASPAQILAAGRLFSALSGFLLLVVIYRTLREVSLHRLVALTVVAVVALSATMLPSFSVARNDSLSALFGTAGIWLVVRGLNRPGAMLEYLAAGALSACAVLTKQTWSFVPLCAGLFLALLCLREGRSAVVRLAVYVGGGVAATLPALAFMVADPERVFFELVTAPYLVTIDWYARIDQTSHFDWDRVAFRYARFLAQPGGALLLIAAVVLWRNDVRKLPAVLLTAVGERSFVLLLGICTLGAMLFALFPRALHVYYFVPTVIMAALFVGTILARMQPWSAAPRRSILALGCLLASTPGLLEIALSLDSLARGRGGVDRVAADARVLQSQLCGLQRPALVGTLSPVRVLAAGHRIYPQLTSGPFAFRSAHLWNAEELAWLGAVGPHTLDAMFTARRPDAIYVGHEQPWKPDSGIELDDALANWALTHGYREFAFPGSRTKKVFLAPGVPEARNCT